MKDDVKRRKISKMDAIRQQFTEINKRVFNLRDGEVLKMQKEYGANYKKSMGVVIISLQNIANDYTASHELARLLWEFNGREQTLLAAMLEEPEKVKIQELEAHLLKTHTPELWEQIARVLLRKLPQIASHISQWLAGREEVLQTYAVLTLGYCTEVFSVAVLEQILALNVQKESYLEKCINRVLLKIGIKSEDAFNLMKNNALFQERNPDLQEEIASFY